MIYNCSVLPNAPMNEATYREKYKIQTVRSPILLQHSSIHHRGIQEYEYIVNKTSSYTTKDLKEMYLYSWTIQSFHSFGILEYLARYYQMTEDISLMEFYQIILDYCRERESFFSKEYHMLKKHIDDGYSGKGWSHYDPELGEINWPFEEASVARFLMLKKEALFEEIEKFVEFFEKRKNFNSEKEVLKDLIKFQIFLLTTRDDLEENKIEKFEFNWKEFFVNNKKIERIDIQYYFQNLVIEKDQIQWVWEVVWFGRHEMKYKFHPKLLQEIK
jgi:hypothetical protein